MDASRLRAAAALIRARNEIDAELSVIVGRPPLSGHLAEWLASEVLGVQLEAAATARGIDGRFSRDSPLADRTVNVKYLGKQEGILDVSDFPGLDFYLVLAGPKAGVGTSKGTTRPWVIAQAFVFNASDLAEHVKPGTAVGVPAALWSAAEIYPKQTSNLLPLTEEQTKMLALFGAG
jgi:hypothetical protein